MNSSGAVAGGAESAPVYEIYALKYMGPTPLIPLQMMRFVVNKEWDEMIQLRFNSIVTCRPSEGRMGSLLWIRAVAQRGLGSTDMRIMSIR